MIVYPIEFHRRLISNVISIFSIFYSCRLPSLDQFDTMQEEWDTH